MGYSEIQYKGQAIMKDIFGGDGWTVYCDGDEVVFDTIEEAKAFIDKAF